MKMMLVRMGELYLTILLLACFHNFALSDYQGMNCISGWHLQIEMSLVILLLIGLYLDYLICDVVLRVVHLINPLAVCRLFLCSRVEQFI